MMTMMALPNITHGAAMDVILGLVRLVLFAASSALRVINGALRGEKDIDF